ncbi:MAG: AsmA family protein [Desulfobacteraceae bacterium]|nr:AsmA family protein [Desulfobacteraceae bacterium]
MKGFMKWVLIIGVGLLVLIVGAVLLIPRFVDVQKYKPMVEKLVAEQTGRSFSMGDDITLSVFPWVGVSLSDIHLGNSKGFENTDMITVKRFEVRLKVMPLLSRRIEVSTFVLDTPRFFLEKAKNGKANWEDIGPGTKLKKEKAVSPKEPGTVDPLDADLSIKSLIVGNFSILNGSVSYVDRATGLKKEVTNLDLVLNDISFDKPIGMKLSGKLDGKQVSLDASLGPVGKKPGSEDLYFDMNLKALGQLSIHLKGKIIQPMSAPKMIANLDVAAFSPRKFLSGLGVPFPVNTADPEVLNRVALKTRLEASPTALKLSDGVLTLDDSAIIFLVGAKTFDKPDLKFDLKVDSIDLDRYLPLSDEKSPQQNLDQKSSAKKVDRAEKIDYDPLRTLVLDGKLRVGSLKVANIKIHDFMAHIIGKNGVFDLNPLSLNLYQGSLLSKVRLDVRKNDPRTQLTLDAKDIQAGPLLKDAIGRQIIEGTLVAGMSLKLIGDNWDMVKKSLMGKGELKFLDGAVLGMDIAKMVSNPVSGSVEKSPEKSKTDFTEFNIPFSVDKGIVNIPGAKVVSPFIRLMAKGDANLVKEDLDFKVIPRFVTTTEGQGDTKDNPGLVVPLLITGSFDSPRIRPDLKAMVGDGVPDLENIKQIFNKKASSNSKGESVEDEVKGLLKGFMPGLKK